MKEPDIERLKNIVVEVQLAIEFSEYGPDFLEDMMFLIAYIDERVPVMTASKLLIVEFIANADFDMYEYKQVKKLVDALAALSK